jgi:hypothetical protein
VKSRLAVLNPNSEDNFFELFNIVPHALFDRLRQGKVLIHNWHTPAWETEERIMPMPIRLYYNPYGLISNPLAKAEEH